MGERKVLNKYFPPDFDPKLVPRTKWDAFKQIETRMMIPFNIQCISCGEFMYRGTKFNMRKEDVHGDDYKGVRKFRFYMKCALCNREITFVTDPENMDYAMENGAKRLFEVWKEQEKVEKDAIQKREDEEKADAMKALEHRTIDSKLEMDIMDALEETKAMAGKRNAIRPDDILAMRAAEDAVTGAKVKDKGEDDDESAVQAAFMKKKALKRLDDSDEEEGGSGPAGNGSSSGGVGVSDPLAPKEASKPPAATIKPMIKPVLNVKVKKRKADGAAGGAKAKKGSEGGGAATDGAKAGANGGAKDEKKEAAAVTAPAPSAGLGGLLAGYGSSGED